MKKFRWIGKSEDGSVVTLTKKNDVFVLSSSVTKDTKKVAVLDIETTGLDSVTDDIIELCIYLITVDENGFIVSIDEKYQSLQDTALEISETIESITGIKKEMLANQKIDWSIVDNIIEKADFCFSFNAFFDRPFVDRDSKGSYNSIWADAYSQIPWDDFGFPRSNLESLCLYHGFFYDAHRAESDVIALINLMGQKMPYNETKTYIAELADKIYVEQYIAVARKTPFPKKDILKKLKMSWNNQFLVWYKMGLSKESALLLKDELTKEIYDGVDTNISIRKLEKNQIFKGIKYYIDSGLLNADSDTKYNKSHVVIVRNTPIETRFILNKNLYYFSKKRKFWYKYINEPEYETEKQWLVLNNVVESSDSDQVSLVENSYYKKGVTLNE